jgi:hypothetical protein
MYRLKYTFVFLIVLLCGASSDAWKAGILANSLSPLNIPTYEGSGEITHPDILVFTKPWNGYLYWLAATPYPGRNERFENPSVFVSNDGIGWTVPEGLKNPIAGPPPSGHLSDPDIIYLKEAGIRVYYRWTDGTHEKIFSIMSGDGRKWSRPVEIIAGLEGEIVSPSVSVKGSIYYMFSVNAGGKTPVVEMRKSQDGLKWSEAKIAEIPYSEEKIWHIDVGYIESRREFWMLSLRYPSSSLYLSISKDGQRFHNLVSPLLTKSADNNAWDGYGLYRSTFHITDGGEFLLWYAGMKNNASRIGFIRSTVGEALAFMGEDNL